MINYQHFNHIIFRWLDSLAAFSHVEQGTLDSVDRLKPESYAIVSSRPLRSITPHFNQAFFTQLLPIQCHRPRILRQRTNTMDKQAQCSTNRLFCRPCAKWTLGIRSQLLRRSIGKGQLRPSLHLSPLCRLLVRRPSSQDRKSSGHHVGEFLSMNNPG